MSNTSGQETDAQHKFFDNNNQEECHNSNDDNNNNNSSTGDKMRPPATIQVTAKVLFGSVTAISALNAERKKKS